MEQKKIRNIQMWSMIAGFMVLFGLFFFGLYERMNQNQTFVFFRQAEDYMADFFNVVLYSRDLNPYVNEINGLDEKAYFPLSYLIFFVFGKLMGFDGYDGTVASINYMELAVAGFIMALMMALLAVQLFDALEYPKGYKAVITAIMMLSGVGIFSYERGNLIVLAVSGMLFFLVTYESENKILRELGYMSLAVAAALKGYPALLGILLLYNKQWKEAVRLAVYGIMFSFGPFLLMEGGLGNIGQWKTNLSLNTLKYEFVEQPKLGYHYFIAYAENATIEQQEHWRDMWKPIVTVLAAFSSILGCFQKKKWIVVGTLVAAILMLPSNCGYYCLLYIFPVIILYLNNKEKRWIDLIYVPIFLMLLSPFQIIQKDTGKNLTLLWSNIAICIMFGCFLLENTWSMIQVIREKKLKGIADNGN